MSRENQTKVSFNSNRNYLSYEISEDDVCVATSGFGISGDELREFLKDEPLALDIVLNSDSRDMRSIPTPIFNKLKSDWFNARHTTYRNFLFNKEDIETERGREIAWTLIEAYMNDQAVCIISKEGWEMYPSDELGMCSTDGLTRIVRIGSTTSSAGSSLIELETINSDGGSLVSLKGIKEVITLRGI